MVVGTAYSQREEKKETKSSNNFRLAIYLEHLLQFLRPKKKVGGHSSVCHGIIYGLPIS